MLDANHLGRPDRRLLAGLSWSLLAALIIQFPLVFLGQIWVTVDTYHYYAMVSEYSRALGEGVLFPKWTASGNQGLGHPGLLYTYPLFFYIASALQLMGMETWLAIRATSLLATAACCACAFFAFNRLLGLRWALLAAIIVGTMPFMFWSLNFYSGFPWYLSFPFLVTFVVSSLLPRSDRIDLAVVFSLAGMALSHILTAYMACLCVPLAVLYRNHEGRLVETLRRTFNWGISCALGLGLAMFYVFPALTTQHLVKFDSFYQEGVLDWHNSFALPVLSSQWYRSYWSLPQWHIPIVLLVLIGVFAGILYTTRSRQTVRWKFVAACLICAVLGLLLASDTAYPLYALSPHFQVVQRPLRFLTVTSVALAVATPVALSIALAAASNRRRVVALSLAVIAMPLVVFLYQTVDISLLQKSSFVATAANLKKAPQLENSLPINAGPQWRDYLANGGFANACRQGGLSCESVVNRSHERVWQITATRAGVVPLPVFWFPSWALQLNGRETPVAIDEPTGLIALALPAAGSYEVRLQWRDLPQETRGRWMTLVALGAVLVVAIRRRTRAPDTRAALPHPR